MTNDKRSTIALWIFVGVVLGLPLLYWTIFYVAAQAGVQLSRNVFGVVRCFGPTIAAVAALTYIGGRGAWRPLWTSLIQWRVSGRLYALALLTPLAVMSLALGITYIVQPDVFSLGEINPLKLVAILIILPFLDGPLGEEPGWRGYFLPALMQRYSAIVASLIVGLIWYLWHLPHYHVDGKDMSGDFLFKYLLFIFALSFMHTWLYKKTGGSVLIHVLFHNMTNYVVLLSFTLFPALKGVALDNTVYFYSMMALGALAAGSLWIQSRIRGSSTA